MIVVVAVVCIYKQYDAESGSGIMQITMAKQTTDDVEGEIVCEWSLVLLHASSTTTTPLLRYWRAT